MPGIFGSSGGRPATIGIDAGGLRGFLSGDTAVVRASPQRLGLVAELASRFGGRATELGKLRDLVAPGFGKITESRVQAVDRARQRSVSDAV